LEEYLEVVYLEPVDREGAAETLVIGELVIVGM